MSTESTTIKDAAGRERNIFEGRQFVVRGAERYALNLSLLFNLALIITLAWSNVSWMRAVHALTARLSGGSVFVVPPDGRTVAREASEFRMGATPLEARALAWEVVSLVAGADSSNERRASANFGRARQLMTDALREDFDLTLAPEAADLERAGVFKLIKAWDQGVREAKAEEIPEGHSIDDAGHHVTVRARVEAFRVDTGEPLMRRDIGYYVRLQPTPAGRTVDHPWGLVVAAIAPLPPHLVRETTDAAAHQPKEEPNP